MSYTVWAAMWRSQNGLDGATEYLIHDQCVPALFSTRREARAFIQREYGYIRDRSNLRGEPHGWRMPKAVRVTVERAE